MGSAVLQKNKKKFYKNIIKLKNIIQFCFKKTN